ncbi:LacI family DNA-binding transcriptional regulator [Streptomyces sp. A73]|nr:LacI family DNA-binding transcriptional regulator [Streptomyces sp. A73]
MVKITDVARRAGVSPSTVSYVLSGKRSISAATQRRVEASIRELGYRPHAGARALASSRSNVLALVMPLRSGIHVPVQMQFAGAVVTTARGHDHDVLLLTQEEGEDGLRRVADSALVDALIVMDVQLRDARVPLLRTLPLLMEAFQQAGMRIPQDLSMVAVCPDELAENTAVPVTSVAIPAAEVGERAVGLLMDKLNGRSVPDATLLPPRLTPRASTAPRGSG